MAEQDVYLRQGFGRPVGLGKGIGLLIVDFVNGFADPGQFGGGNIQPAMERTRDLLSLARARSWKVAHSRIVYMDNDADANPFSIKIPGMLSLKEKDRSSQIVEQLQPVDGELVVEKSVPSAFFGTMLAPWLLSHRVDSLIVAGCTTSGCVRASVVDAVSWGLRVTVPADCVGDRALAPHEANLFDIGQKYGDVTSFESLKASLA